MAKVKNKTKKTTGVKYEQPIDWFSITRHFALVMTLLHFAELIQMEQLEDIYICPFVCSHDHLQDVKDAEALSRIDFDQPFSLKVSAKIHVLSREYQDP